MIRLKYIGLFVSLLLLWSCSASRKASSKRADSVVLKPETDIAIAPIVGSSVAPISSAEQRYIDLYSQMAIEEMHRSGVPASITLAQGMIESNYGRSILATNANNHFGIKCHDWVGESIRMDDDEADECFRKYDSVAQSFYDHSEFLMTRPRYSFLFDLKRTDYEGWAKGLKQAGYATNPQYANMLIAKIEELGLYKFDDVQRTDSVKAEIAEANAIEHSNSNHNNIQTTETEIETETKTEESTTSTLSISLSDEQPPVVRARASRTETTNGIPYIVVAAGETKRSIAKEFNLFPHEIAGYNDLNSDFTPYSGQIIFLQPKKNRAEKGITAHSVQEGETLYYISQLYGIKYKSLLKINHFSETHTLLQGDIVKLR